VSNAAELPIGVWSAVRAPAGLGRSASGLGALVPGVRLVIGPLT
jgi:hypothetical protein